MENETNDQELLVLETNYQQQIVLEEQYRKLAMRDGANDILDAKAGTIIQASGILVAVLSLLSIPNLIFDDPSVLAVTLAVVALVIFGIIVFLTLFSASPKDYETPGKDDMDTIVSRYLDVSESICYQQVLLDVATSSKQRAVINKQKAKDISIATWLLLVQVVFLVSVLIAIFIAQVA